MDFFARQALAPRNCAAASAICRSSPACGCSTSDDGPSRGVRLIEFRTGTGFAFEIAVDRGFDVGRCEYRGASLGWMPPTLMPGPWFFEDQSRLRLAARRARRLQQHLRPTSISATPRRPRSPTTISRPGRPSATACMTGPR